MRTNGKLTRGDTYPVVDSQRETMRDFSIFKKKNCVGMDDPRKRESHKEGRKGLMQEHSDPFTPTDNLRTFSSPMGQIVIEARVRTAKKKGNAGESSWESEEINKAQDTVQNWADICCVGKTYQLRFWGEEMGEGGGSTTSNSEKRKETICIKWTNGVPWAQGPTGRCASMKREGGGEKKKGKRGQLKRKQFSIKCVRHEVRMRLPLEWEETL